MGFFSRKQSASGGDSARPRTRASTSSEVQAAEMRNRARRRLIGALALVVAAVIVVPMLIDTSPPEDQPAPVVVPDIPPLPSPGVAALPPENGAQAAADAEGTVLPEPQPLADDDAAPGGAGTPAAPPASHEATEAAAPPESKPKTEKPAVREPDPMGERTDDGSVALALLEGRDPGKPAAPASQARGNFVLQIAAYTTDKDAQSRRDKLVAAGVTNAYVESGVSGGKPTYRLRVGPFPTRDAAQAAQTRLRALGYENGFISTK